MQRTWQAAGAVVAGRGAYLGHGYEALHRLQPLQTEGPAEGIEHCGLSGNDQKARRRSGTISMRVFLFAGPAERRSNQPIAGATRNHALDAGIEGACGK